MIIVQEQINNRIFNILIGKTCKENIEIIKKSDYFDLWFHVDKEKSCHVVVQEVLNKNIQNNIYPPEIIEKAAILCKQNSKFINKKNTIICYTNIENIIIGKILGEVYFENETNIKYIYI